MSAGTVPSAATAPDHVDVNISRNEQSALSDLPTSGGFSSATMGFRHTVSTSCSKIQSLQFVPLKTTSVQLLTASLLLLVRPHLPLILDLNI